MMRLLVDMNGVTTVVSDFESQSQRLNTYRDTINKVKNNCPCSGAIRTALRASLNNILEEMDEERKLYGILGNMLEQNLSNYRICEETIARCDNTTIVWGDVTGSADGKDDLLKFITVDPNRFIELGPGGQLDFGWKDIIKSFGSAGSIFGIVNSISKAKSWVDWGNVGIDITKTISSIAKDYNSYNKIGRAIGTTNSNAYFWRNFFGVNKVGYASKASSASARFYNNLHNTTSPYKLSGIFDAFTGKKGVVSSVASWAGLALSGIANTFSNIEEQKESNGTMSTGRVIAETISETVIDTAIAAAGSAVVGAAIATVTGAVAAPVVVAAATGLAIAGINAGVEALTGKSATEWVSDAVLDTASAIGSAVADGAKAVANWFNKLSFA